MGEIKTIALDQVMLHYQLIQMNHFELWFTHIIFDFPGYDGDTPPSKTGATCAMHTVWNFQRQPSLFVQLKFNSEPPSGVKMLMKEN